MRERNADVNSFARPKLLPFVSKILFPQRRRLRRKCPRPVEMIQRASEMSRILLVEDDPDVRVVLEHVLFDAGYDVDTAANVRDGSHLLDSREFDLLLADGRLPDGTGIELAELADARGIPVLILTGYAFILRELSAGNLDKYRVLLKPVQPREIVVAVEEALRDGARLGLGASHD
jgi:DNA-binding NtrC family response regulator